MYKCTECGCEYEIKPDFCECGNDEFVITVEDDNRAEEKVNEEKIEKEPEVIMPQPAKSNYTYSTPKAKKTFSDQYPLLSRLFNSLDPISVGIFALCIILSIIIVLIKVDSSENLITEETKNTVYKEIPNIDKFWNNTAAEVKTAQKEKTEPEKTVPAPIINVPKTINKTTSPKTTVVKLTKKHQKQTARKNTQTVKPKQTTKSTQPVQQKPSVTIKNTSVQNTQTQVQSTKPAAPAVTQQPVQPIVKQEVDYAKLQAELNNYKALLRNTIGRKIDFTRVVGDGNCTVSFKINSEGKLINRSFSKQSSNITLNDAVYSAIMSTPKFNPPPDGYKNETLNLYIKFYNGNFEISLK